MSDTPNPGSPEAVAKGCLCPVLDNHHGGGVAKVFLDDDGKPIPDGKTVFWINEECPLHAGGKHEGDA